MRYRVRAVLVLLSPIALAGCPSGGNPDATIHYTQIGACTQADFPNGHVTAQPLQAIVIFKVSSVDNSAVNQTWSFNSANFKVNPPSSTQSNLGSTGPVTNSSPSERTAQQLRRYRCRNRETRRLRRRPNELYTALSAAQHFAGSGHDRGKGELKSNLVPVRAELQFALG